MPAGADWSEYVTLPEGGDKLTSPEFKMTCAEAARVHACDHPAHGDQIRTVCAKSCDSCPKKVCPSANRTQSSDATETSALPATTLPAAGDGQGSDKDDDDDDNDNAGSLILTKYQKYIWPKAVVPWKYDGDWGEQLLVLLYN